MDIAIALIGAGRMGSFVGGQLPPNAKNIVIDRDADKARQLAQRIGAAYAGELFAAQEADVIVIVLPGPVVSEVAAQLGGIAKAGAVVLNMATEGVISEKTKAAHPLIRYVDAKIIGHARSMQMGAPGYVVIHTRDEQIYAKAARCLPGFAKVMTGDAGLVPNLNKIGSEEGIRTAVRVRERLKPYALPKDWEDIIIYTVCAGTMRAYVEGDLGGFGRALADQLEAGQQGS